MKSAGPPAGPIASPSRRFLAATLDSLPFLALFVVSRRATGPRLRRRHLAILGIEAVYGIGLVATRGQTIGQTLLGIRIVDRNSLGRPSLRQSAVRWLVASATRSIPLLLPEPQSVRELEEVRPEIERLRQEHKGDRVGLNEALMQLYRARRISPWTGFARVIPFVLLDGANAWMRRRGPLHQGLHDRAANTLVIGPVSTLG